MTQRTQTDPGDPGPPADPVPDPPAWGAHRPGLTFRILVRASRAVPQVPLVKQLAFLLRRIARLVAADPVDVVHWGLRLRLLTRGNISESTFLFMPRRWDRSERRFLARELGPGAVFVDVGANAGGYLWWLLHLLGRDLRAVAVEPDPDLYRRLRFNLATNGFDHVAVVGAAVGPEAGEGWLRIDRRNLGESALAESPTGPPGPAGAGWGRDPDERPGAGTDRVRVPVRRLPELVVAAGLSRIDALKIDVEGLEPPILQDFYDRAPEALWPRLLVVERQPGPEHSALVARLEGLGYRQALASRLNVVLRRGG